MEASLHFKEQEGAVVIEGDHAGEFDPANLAHRMMDAAAQMIPDIRAKAAGQFTDGDRYRAMRAMVVISDQNPDLAMELEEQMTDLDDAMTEANVDAAFNKLITLLNAKVEQAQNEQLSALANVHRAEAVGKIIVPGPRRIAKVVTHQTYGSSEIFMLPETTIMDRDVCRSQESIADTDAASTESPSCD